MPRGSWRIRGGAAFLVDAPDGLAYGIAHQGSVGSVDGRVLLSPDRWQQLEGRSIVDSPRRVVVDAAHPPESRFVVEAVHAPDVRQVRRRESPQFLHVAVHMEERVALGRVVPKRPLVWRYHGRNQWRNGAIVAARRFLSAPADIVFSRSRLFAETRRFLRARGFVAEADVLESDVPGSIVVGTAFVTFLVFFLKTSQSLYRLQLHRRLRIRFHSRRNGKVCSARNVSCQREQARDHQLLHQYGMQEQRESGGMRSGLRLRVRRRHRYRYDQARSCRQVRARLPSPRQRHLRTGSQRELLQGGVHRDGLRQLRRGGVG